MQRISNKYIGKIALLAIILFGSPWLVHGAEETIALSTSEIGWAMKVKAPGFALDQRHVEPAGHAYFMASDRARQMIVSGRIEKVQKVGTATDAREYFWEETKKTPFKTDDTRCLNQGRRLLASSNVGGLMRIHIILSSVKNIRKEMS